MRGLQLEEPDDITYGQLLHVLSSSGRWREALTVLQQIKRRNLRHYTSAIRACTQPDAPDFEGLETYRQMRGEGIVPDLHAYNVVLQSLRPAANARAAEEALALYAEMTGAGQARGQGKGQGKGKGKGKGKGAGSSRAAAPAATPTAAAVATAIAPDIVTFTVLISLLEKHGRRGDALRLFADGCARGVLMQASLDSLWERDLSRLSYQLVRAAVDYALGEVVRDYNVQLKAAAGSKDPNVHDLVLITGVDSSTSSSPPLARGGGGGGQPPPPPPPRQPLPLPSASVPSPETRQGLAHLVLREKGGGGYLAPRVAAGVLTVGKEQLRRWLQDGAPA
jgi:pentatricopeptide repeat protein